MMSSTPPNGALEDATIDNMDLCELRQRLKEMRDAKIAQKDKFLAELELAQRTNSFSPIPVTNLMATINAAAQMDAQQITINAAAQMDAQQITTLVTTLVSAMKSELLSQIKQEILAVFQQHPTQQSTTSPSFSAAPSGSQVSSGQQAVFSPSGSTQMPQGTPASTSAGGSNNPTLTTIVLNEYDKTVEVDQRKLRNPELTPIALRNRKLAYNRYANDSKSSSTKQQHGERTSATNTSSSSILSTAAHHSSAQLPDNHNEGKWPPPSDPRSNFFFYSYYLYVVVFFHSKKGGLRYKLARQFSIVTYFRFSLFLFSLQIYYA